MGFLDETRSHTGRVYRNKMDDIKQVLSKKDYSDFLEAMNDTTISQAAIARVLRKRGIEISKSTVSAFRQELFANRGDTNDVS